MTKFTASAAQALCYARNLANGGELRLQADVDGVCSTMSTRSMGGLRSMIGALM